MIMTYTLEKREAIKREQISFPTPDLPVYLHLSLNLTSLLNLTYLRVSDAYVLWIPSPHPLKALGPAVICSLSYIHQWPPLHFFFLFKSSLGTVFLFCFSASIHRKTSQKGLSVFANSFWPPPTWPVPHTHSFSFQATSCWEFAPLIPLKFCCKGHQRSLSCLNPVVDPFYHLFNFSAAHDTVDHCLIKIQFLGFQETIVFCFSFCLNGHFL